MQTLLIPILLSLLVACSTVPDGRNIRQAPKNLTFTPNNEYIIGANDTVFVRVGNQAELGGSYVVSLSGYINLPLVGLQKAKDFTEAQLTRALVQSLEKFIRNPDVIVTVTGYDSYRVFISGGVKAAGVYQLKEKTTLLQVLSAAGGLTDFAAGNILIHRTDASGNIEKYFVRHKDILRGADNLSAFVVERGDVILVQ
ncbi:MAG TPA: polysaccharide biosynthesis/export family protein [Oligoflexus sp.]|uniref:polysaccharide biosynthesis/export family protein n=1 Tax=Oligoflexus sp. TaxID=1971216 RepID=UPI002D670E9C|nr:polysaccharide biosynthesis/export family protein [Oligoflexus sp.]HYX35615.1 polysaccharide biosynthesis/export family protein [Oligoflexus sp.]